MARARNIKPSFFDNDLLAEIEPLGRLLFIGLWCIADRDGYLEYRPNKIKKQILGYDDCDIKALINQLESRGFIEVYEVDNSKYINIIKFSNHQKPHSKEQVSSTPHPRLCDTTTKVGASNDLGDGKHALIADRGMLIEERGTPIPLPHKKSVCASPDKISFAFSRIKEVWKKYDFLVDAKGAREAISEEELYDKVDEVIASIENWSSCLQNKIDTGSHKMKLSTFLYNYWENEPDTPQEIEFDSSDIWDEEGNPIIKEVKK